MNTLRLFFLIASVGFGFPTAFASQKTDNFQLDSNKGPVKLSDFRGKVVMLYFGYTSCPDVCPTSLSRISMAVKSLSDEEKSKIQPVFISLDPERDKKDKIAQYVKYFLPNMIGLSGTEKQIEKVARQFKITYRKTEVESDIGYVVDHASIYFIIGGDGKLYSHLLHNATKQEIAQSLRSAVKDGGVVKQL